VEQKRLTPLNHSRHNGEEENEGKQKRKQMGKTKDEKLQMPISSLEFLDFSLYFDKNLYR
jgi:hypothetical protein